MATRRVADTYAGVQGGAGGNCAGHPSVVTGGSPQSLLADLSHELGTVAGREHARMWNHCLTRVNLQQAIR